MKIDSFEFPDGLKYLKGHVWVRTNKKGDEATIGITSLGSSLAKEIVHIDLPEDGEEFEPMKPLATYETIKSVTEVPAPYLCKIKKANTKLLDNPSLINTDCYGDGWIAKIKIIDGGNKEVMDVKEAVKYYKTVLDKEKERYKGIYE